jgi:iron complex outermembrane receptor protein
MKQIVFLISYALMLTHAMGQVNLSGRVYDEHENPLAGANVILVGTFLGTTTDYNGAFSFRDLEEGTYQIQASFIGYETHEQKLELHSDLELVIDMQRKSILADEVLVTATRATSHIPVAYTNIEKERIEKTNLGQDIPYLLEQTPSLVLTSDAGAGVGYSSFRIRGSDITRINVTVNGIPLNDSESHGTWWVDLPDFASSVENIQVQRGVGSSTNGAGAFGATVNFQTFDLRPEPNGELNVSAGSFNTYKTNVLLGTGLIQNRFVFDARVSKIYSDGYIDRAFSDLGSLSLSGAYYGESDLLKLIFLTGKEKTYQAWDGVPSSVLDTNRTYNGIGQYIDADGRIQYYENETDNYWQDHVQLFYTRELSEYATLNFALHYTYGRGFYEQYKQGEDLADYQMDMVVIGGDTIRSSDLIRQKWLDNDFYGMTYSLNFKKHRWDFILGGAWNRYLGDHFGKVIWARIAPQDSFNHEWYRNDATKTDFNIYGKVTYRMNSNLSFHGDLQYRDIGYRLYGVDDDLRLIDQDHHFRFINPKFGIMYRFSDRHDAFFSYAMGNREPNRYNFIDADPSESYPQHETLHDFELGYQMQSRHLALGMNIFYMNYRNQLVLTGEINDVGSPVMTNAKESFRRGIEIHAGIEILQTLHWEANLALSQNRILNFTEYVDDWDTWTQRSRYLGTTNISFSPGLVAASSIQFEPVPGLQASLNSKYVGSQYIDNTSSTERALDSYFLNDLLLNYEIHPSFLDAVVFRIMINNLFNVAYESNAWIYRYIYEGEEEYLDGYFPQAGIHFLAGVSVRF